MQSQQQHFTPHRAFCSPSRDKSTELSSTAASTSCSTPSAPPTLDDGKYLYNPATGQIEIQWIQGIGSEKAAAPQGRLMATVINGILSRKLPWGLVLLGVFLVIVVELLGVRSLTFAVGAYLSIATTLAIFCGGVMRWMVDRAVARAGGNAAETESEISPGSLFASGLIAAGGIMGLLGVARKLYEAATGSELHVWFAAGSAVYQMLYRQPLSVVMFALLAFSLLLLRPQAAGWQIAQFSPRL